ncbi:MAG: peptidoglycan-binding protein LysM [Pseudomonadota bacterium]
MGLFSFVRDAGKKLFGGGDDPAEAIQKEVADLGLEGDVEVTVEGDKVVIAGSAPSQELREKIILAAGNVDGIASVEDNIQPEDTSDAADFHTVEKGDTLWAVSQKAYGDGSKYMKIFEANKPMLSDPDKIYPGQVLRVPAEG